MKNGNIVPKSKEVVVMKKIFAICMAVIMCFTLCSCGEMTLEKAVKKADKLVKKYDRKEIANCSYEGKYIADFDDEGTNVYKITAKVMDDSIDFDDVVDKIQNDVSPKFEKMFEECYCAVMITVDGYQDGEIEMLLNGKPINEWIG